MIAVLHQVGLNYDLAVYDWERMTAILRMNDAGFPTGRGPILTNTHVVWEATDEQGVTKLRTHRLPER